MIARGSQGPDPYRIGGSGRPTQFSALEKMGLVIGGHQDKVVQHLQNIDAQTRRMVSQLGNLVGHLLQGQAPSLNGPSMFSLP